MNDNRPTFIEIDGTRIATSYILMWRWRGESLTIWLAHRATVMDFDDPNGVLDRKLISMFRPAAALEELTDESARS